MMQRTKEQFKQELELTLSTTPWSSRKEISREMHLKWWNELEVGDKAHIERYVDIDPCTIIYKTDKSIAVRIDRASLLPDSPADNNQRWNILEDEYGQVEMFHLHTGKDFGFMNRQGDKLLPEWDKFVDFDFYNN